MYVRTYRISKIKYTTMILAAVPYVFFCAVNIPCFETKYDANLEEMPCHFLFYQPLHTSISEEYL